MKIKIKAQPNSGRQEIVKITEDEYKVFLKKAPEDGKANIELEKILKKYFGKNVKVIKGFTSKNKVVEVE
jgi:uncharacterized protein (TIGR00251 family)